MNHGIDRRILGEIFYCALCGTQEMRKSAISRPVDINAIEKGIEKCIAIVHVSPLVET